MIKKDELYFGGTTSGETLKPFLFHVVMMFVLPVMAFFFSRDMLASRGYSDKDRNIYAGFISIVFVILVIVSYVLRIIADEDNWTPQNKAAAAVEAKTSKQTKTKAKTQTPLVVQNTQETKTPQNNKNVKQKSAPQKVEEPEEVTASKSHNESNTVTQRNTANQKKEKNTAPATAKKNNPSNSKNSKAAPKAKKEEVKQQPIPPKRKIKSNNPFDYII